MKTSILAACMSALTLVTFGQQFNSATASLAVNGDATGAVGQGPSFPSITFADGVAVDILGAPSAPIALLVGQFSSGALSVGGFSIDLQLAAGISIVISGFAPGPVPGSTDATGKFRGMQTLAACYQSGSCAAAGAISFAVQAIVTDPTGPFGVNSTAATSVTLAHDASTTFSLLDDQSAHYQFPTGFSFPFYGAAYTDCFVSANGFISFGAADTGFPLPSVSCIRNGVPRIMGFYDNLFPFQPGVISATSWHDAGNGYIRFRYDHVAEFADLSGPHGADVIIDDAGNISIFAHEYNQAPFIDTAVGITPGNGIDNGAVTVPGSTPFGRDLSADVVSGGRAIPANVGAFEVFDHTSLMVLNPFDLAGFNYPTGIRFTRDPILGGYLVH